MVHLDLELEEGAFAARPWIDALKGRGGGEAGGGDMVLHAAPMMWGSSPY